MKVTKENIDQLDWEKLSGLIPAIVQDADSGIILMQAFMSPESLNQTIETELVTFYSRSRQELWTKGESSGNKLDCMEISSDCDGDSLKVIARPSGPVCHTGAVTCWEDSKQPELSFLLELEGIIQRRKSDSPEVSYTARLHQRGLNFIAQKVGEEAVETVIAAIGDTDKEFLEESADLLYHLLVLLSKKNLALLDIVAVLKSRHQAQN